MEISIHKKMSTPRSTKRPRSEQGSPFRRFPAVSENRNCIWITPDMLKEFKARVTRAHTVTLKFNNINQRAAEIDTARRKMPSLLTDRSYTSHDVKDPMTYRPVKVYVEGVSKTHSAGNNVTMASNRFPDYRKQSSFVAERSKYKPKKKSDALRTSENSNTRSMDSGDDGGELPDDVIETVAKANTVNTEYPAHILPEIRAAPCPIHTKRDKPKGQESIYATNSHMNMKSPRRLQLNPITNVGVNQHPSHNGLDKQTAQRRNTRLDINVKIPEQYPVIRPTLPKNMSSKDYVMTWLIHGSAPQGSNHFPDIIPNNHVKTKKKKTPRRSDLSE